FGRMFVRAAIGDGARHMEVTPGSRRLAKQSRRMVLALAILVAIGAGFLRQHAPRIDGGIGRPVADFTLADTAGRPVALHDFRRSAAVVLVFMGTDCPVGNLYMPRLVELSRAYRKKNIAFIIVNANAHESPEEVAEHARSHHVTFPVLKGQGNRVADQLGVERTCSTLVIDCRGRLRYRGAIDDQYDRGKRKTAAARNYLNDALDAVLAGRSVAMPTTPVVGCLIDRASPIATVG